MAETSMHDAIPLKSAGDCPSCTTRDLISDLPDALIRHVFSFLPLRDVVRTSVLSKRWRSTWTTTTDIVFNGFLFFYRSVGYRPRSTMEMSSILESILSRYASATVKKFHVTGFLCDREADCPKVDLWLHFAVQHRVEYLRLWPDWSSDFLYILPESLCCLSSLVCLEVGECLFPLGVTIRWPCLKVLWIGNVELSDDVLGQIFRGSPVLETLILGGCWGLKNVIVDSLSLRELVFMGPSMHGATVEKVCAPYLLCLRVSGLNQAEFRLDDVSSLVEAELDFFIEIDGSYSECCGLLKKLLKKLCRVPAITIGSWCLRMLSLLEKDRVPSPLSNCPNLILHSPVEQRDLLGIAYMLRSSRRLEKLVIRLIHYPVVCSFAMFGFGGKFDKLFNFDEEEFLYLRKWDFECLEHLRRVEIIGFEDTSWDSKPLFALIKLLLGDALVLEKLIIKAESPTRYAPESIQAAVLSKLPSLIQSLLSYPRASTNAEVFFNCDLRKVPSGERMKIRFSG